MFFIIILDLGFVDNSQIKNLPKFDALISNLGK